LKSDAFFDVAKYPTASYKSTRVVFTGDQPSEVIGDLTLHGVTRPVTLKIVSFKCHMPAALKREVCGADATGSFDRADFGMNYGAANGYKTLTKLQIQVEGIKSE
jgi:polyisoprenoid-binding protein YceI